MNILVNDIQSTYTSTKAQNDHVVINIKDNRVGIPEYIQKKIFAPFFTTKDVGEETGLGLSIEYSIVKNYKGEIIVKSETEKVSGFIIKLPILTSKVIKRS